MTLRICNYALSQVVMGELRLPISAFFDFFELIHVHLLLLYPKYFVNLVLLSARSCRAPRPELEDMRSFGFHPPLFWLRRGQV